MSEAEIMVVFTSWWTGEDCTGGVKGGEAIRNGAGRLWGITRGDLVNSRMRVGNYLKQSIRIERKQPVMKMCFVVQWKKIRRSNSDRRIAVAYWTNIIGLPLISIVFIPVLISTASLQWILYTVDFRVVICRMGQVCRPRKSMLHWRLGLEVASASGKMRSEGCRRGLPSRKSVTVMTVNLCVLPCGLRNRHFPRHVWTFSVWLLCSDIFHVVSLLTLR